MTWDYAVLSRTAKECGGPEALMKVIEDRGFQEGLWAGAEAGIKQGRIQMIPVMFLVLAGSAAITIAIQNRAKIVSFYKTKLRKITQEEYETAKGALIQGIKEYDENHPVEEPAVEPSGLQNTTTGG